MTQDEVNKLLEMIGAAITQTIAPLAKRLDALEAKGMEFKGVHQRALSYAKGDIVQAGGDNWIAIDSVRPGQAPGSSGVWQLFNKRQRKGAA
jgi:hypothetical protein